MLKAPIITLTTDFGLKDPFAGLMKGVILGINPDARIVDITHNIQRHNIYEASRVIAMSYKYFPPGSIHIAVVDPGVGGSRRPILVIAEDRFFIGPDNGVFTSIYEESQPEHLKVIHISASDYFLPMSGSTFHGRDIFAPVAAWLSRGTEPGKFGKEIEDHIKLNIPGPLVSNKTIKGRIVSVDNFGNCISNIGRDDMEELASLTSRDKIEIIYRKKQLPLADHYAEYETGLSAIINSFGQLELFVYKGSAAENYNIKTGDSVTVTLI